MDPERRPRARPPPGPVARERAAVLVKTVASRALLQPVKSGLGRIRALPAMSPAAMWESFREQAGGHPALTAHGPHLRAAIDWLRRAQDATPDAGFSRGYSLTWN